MSEKGSSYKVAPITDSVPIPPSSYGKVYKKKNLKWTDRLNNSKIFILKSIIILALSSTAVLVGVGAWYWINNLNVKLGEQEYESVASRLARDLTVRTATTVDLLQVLNNAIQGSCSDSSFPSCTISLKYYLSLSSTLIGSVGMRNFGYSPIVDSAEVSPFESFTSHYYTNGNYSINQTYIYGINSTYDKYPSEAASQRGRYAITVPVLNVGHLDDTYPGENVPESTMILYDLYTDKDTRVAIDLAIGCATSMDNSMNVLSCNAISNVCALVQDEVFKPSAIIFSPVTSSNNMKLEGFAFAVFNWEMILSDSSSYEMWLNSAKMRYKDMQGPPPNAPPGYIPCIGTSEIYIVVYNPMAVMTFMLEDGIAKYIGFGDFHDKEYDSYLIQTQLVIGNSVPYLISYYPTKQYLDSKTSTNSPIAVTVLTLTVIIFMSVALYDYLINRDSREKDLILVVKKQFVRFISHEVRTPLNVVHIGLKVLITEITKFMGKSNPDTKEFIVPKELLMEWQSLIKETENNCDSATEVLNDLINYEKIDAGKLNIEVEPVYMWDVISAAITPFHVQARHSNIEITVELEINRNDVGVTERNKMKELLVLGDKVKLTHVIKNLISNGLKFTACSGKINISGIIDRYLLHSVLNNYVYVYS